MVWYQSARSALLQALMLRGCTPQTCAMEIDRAVVEAHLMRPPHKVRRTVRTYSECTLTPRHVSAHSLQGHVRLSVCSMAHVARHAAAGSLLTCCTKRPI